MGRRLARELIEKGGLVQGGITRLTLLDRAFPEELPKDPRLERVEADFSDGELLGKLLGQRPDVIFHLAAIVSGEAEKNLDLGMAVNFQASLQLLELCRSLALRPKIVFASSVAVFGGDVSRTILDETAARPRSSYGTQKAMVELLMNDYSRRGFVDARSIRLPTIAIRPGRPNAATSSFVSSMIREPLHGKKATYPVALDTEIWIQSPKRVVRNFLHAANIAEKKLGDDRIINLPGLTTTVREMLHSLERLTDPGLIKLVSRQPDAFLEGIVLTWPPNFDPQRATRLGFVADASSEEIIRLYIEEENIML